MKNSNKIILATALTILTAISMTACEKTSGGEKTSDNKKPSNNEEIIITATTDVVAVEGNNDIESVLELDKPYVEKNTDLDLSKFTFDGVEYDFETMKYNDFLESTNTKPMGFPVISYDESNFSGDLYGYARYDEEDNYSTVYCMETELDGRYNPLDNRYSVLSFTNVTDENANDVKIHSFTIFETTKDIEITLAGGFKYRTPTDKKDVIAAFGEGTFVNDVDFLGYCDGSTVLLFDLDSSGVRAERVIMYQLGEKPKASAETTTTIVTTVAETTTFETISIDSPDGPLGFIYTYDSKIDGVGIYGYIGNAQKVVIPAVIEGKEVKSVGYCAFYPSENITEVVIPDSVTEIGDCAFYGCRNLTEVEFPDGLETIGGGAFAGTSLSSINLPDGLTTIGWEAFTSCANLTKVTIPDSVTSIGEGTFDYCRNIVVTYKGKEYTYAEMEDLYKDINSNL